MKRSVTIPRILALVLTGIILLTLTSCNSVPNKPTTETVTENVTDAATETPTVSIAPSNEEKQNEPIPTEEGTTVSGLTVIQKNSVNMLNYLQALLQEILEKKHNRVFVQETFNALINYIRPSSVDEITQAYFSDLLDDLHEFEKLLVHRERLQYLFEQNQAQALRNALPNPLGLLSAVSSGNIVQLVSSVAYMALDAVTSYNSSMSAAEIEFLQQNWELDDQESDIISSLRIQAYMYLLNISREYGIPDDLTLSEDKVLEFGTWKSRSYEEFGAESKVRFYKQNEAQFEGFGQYWLERARAHYENKEYEDCLKSIARYEELNITIYRKDYELAKVLPIAIGAASEIYDDNTYVEAALHFVDLIEKNTDNDDWALHYFAAQTYIDIYSRTNDIQYLRKAYEIEYDNVNHLIYKQKDLNKEYLADVQLEAIPDGTPKEKRTTIENMNAARKETRKTELPPISEPLRLNCDLLLALADQLELDITERTKIQNILFPNGNDLFLIAPLNQKYKGGEIGSEFSLEFKGSDLYIPVEYLSADAVVYVYMNEKDGRKGILDDWEIVEVERNNSHDLKQFKAKYHSKKAETYDFKNANSVEIVIYSLGKEQEIAYRTVFDVSNWTEWIFFPKVEFVSK